VYASPWYYQRNSQKTKKEYDSYLWKHIKSSRIHWKKFQKQKPIFVYEENNWLPRYVIADFICLEHKLIIEIDWWIHDVPEVLELDKHKQNLLHARWYQVIRFTNHDVSENINDVLSDIQNYL